MLKINISSFSYKKGLPLDLTEHGGGFVFDCRWIDNPGRLDAYKQLTGKDTSVASFLETKTDMLLFLNNIYTIIDKVINKYLTRNFDYLALNFGCTGGQHRSVYAAESVTKYIKQHYPHVNVFLSHREFKYL